MIALSEDKARTCLIDYARIAAENGNLDEAKTLFRGCQEYVDLSVVLARERRYDEALEMARAALPDSPVRAHAQLMAVYYEMADLVNAEHHLNAGLEISPDFPRLRLARSVVRMGRRDPAGWTDLHYADWHKELKNALPNTEWWGQHSIEGQHLLVIGQEGFGDQIMFSRFLPALIEQYHPGRLTVSAPGQLLRLFRRTFPGVSFVCSPGDIEGQVDAWIGSSLIPELQLPVATDSYLEFSEESAHEYSKLFPNQERLRVGLAWGGSPKHPQDRNRSMPFESYRPLLDNPGCDFYALQFGEQYTKENTELPDLAKYCEDFSDTAAMLANLDLLITIDTSIVHVAGAIGIPAWVLLRTPISWQWGIPDELNDWYGSVRQFRNRPMADVVSALHWHVAETSVERRRRCAESPAIQAAIPAKEIRTPLNFSYDLQLGDCHAGMPRASEYHACAEWLGSVSYEEAMFLYGLVLVRKPALAVELGSAAGFSTIHIARAIKDAGYGSLTAIEYDPRMAKRTCDRLNTEHLEADVRRMDAYEYLRAETRSIDFLFIDTELGDRFQQLELAWEKLSPGALVVMHDVSPLHPEKARTNTDILALLQARGAPYSYIPSPRGMALISKPIPQLG